MKVQLQIKEKDLGNILMILFPFAIIGMLTIGIMLGSILYSIFGG